MNEATGIAQPMDAKSMVEAILRKVGLKAPTFAKTIGVTYQRVFDVTNGRTKTLTPSIINAICEAYPMVNKNCLYTGEGDLFIEPAEGQDTPNTSSSLSEVMDMSRKVISLLQKLSEREEKLQERIDSINERERELLELERDLLEREAEVQKREAELGLKKSIPA